MPWCIVPWFGFANSSAFGCCLYSFSCCCFFMGGGAPLSAPCLGTVARLVPFLAYDVTAALDVSCAGSIAGCVAFAVLCALCLCLWACCSPLIVRWDIFVVIPMLLVPLLCHTVLLGFVGCLVCCWCSRCFFSLLNVLPSVFGWLLLCFLLFYGFVVVALRGVFVRVQSSRGPIYVGKRNRRGLCAILVQYTIRPRCFCNYVCRLGAQRRRVFVTLCLSTKGKWRRGGCYRTADVNTRQNGDVYAVVYKSKGQEKDLICPQAR